MIMFSFGNPGCLSDILDFSKEKVCVLLTEKPTKPKQNPPLNTQVLVSEP